jgi:hypothetical protein
MRGIGWRVLVLATVAAHLAGCRSLSPPVGKRDVLGLEGGSLHVFHFESTRRGTYVWRGSDGTLRIAAEPPPDAALESTVGLTAKLADTIARAGVEGSVDAEVVERIVALTERTQAVVLMRDAMFRLAEMHLNGVIDSETYVAMYNKAMAGAVALAASDKDLALAMLDRLLEERILMSLTQEDRRGLLREHLGQVQNIRDLLRPEGREGQR